MGANITSGNETFYSNDAGVVDKVDRLSWAHQVRTEVRKTALYRYRRAIGGVTLLAASLAAVHLGRQNLDDLHDGLNTGTQISCPVETAPQSFEIEGKEVAYFLGQDGPEAQKTAVNNVRMQLGHQIARTSEGMPLGNIIIDANVPGDQEHTQAMRIGHEANQILAQTFGANLPEVDISPTSIGNTQSITFEVPSVYLGQQDCPPGTTFA